MPPTLALLLWLILLMALLVFDPARTPGTSVALWVPVVWMFIAGSRLPSVWLGLTSGQAIQVWQEGSPVDRTIDLMLIGLAIAILFARSFNWSSFFARNVALIVFLAFGLVSIVWSDFPFIAFKRWFRDIGSYFLILVILSDPNPLEAVRTVLRRLAYLLIPLCILLDKYYPQMSRQYDNWSGAAFFVGATTSKNMLGALCLASGLFFFWDVVTRWKDRKDKQTKRILLVDAAFIAMTISLLNLANSATSRVCLILGCLVILATHTKFFNRHPGILKTAIPMCFLAYLIAAFGFNLNGNLAQAVGRNPTLTDRTAIWDAVLSTHTNPIIGTGYESFWLGPRVYQIWRVEPGINETHNGYLDIYTNLGYLGLFSLAAFLIASYRKICQMSVGALSSASFGFAVWTILLFYNMTEAAFKAGLLWMTFLLGVMVMPVRAEEAAPEEVPSPVRGGWTQPRSAERGLTFRDSVRSSGTPFRP